MTLSTCLPGAYKTKQALYTLYNGAHLQITTKMFLRMPPSDALALTGLRGQAPRKHRALALLAPDTS